MNRRFTSVVVEADGGSRGNPGNAAYGAVLKDASSGAVIAERGERIGVATNNVAEYRGLIGGLELYREHAEGADLEVRMDSKLVVEQMSGRWKIKHPSMRPLALEANRLAPPGVRYTWVPRERNKHADRLANEALDGPEGVVVGGPVTEDVEVAALTAAQTATQTADLVAAQVAADDAAQSGAPGADSPTTLVLVRHGETDHTRRRVFSGRAGADPALNADGRVQVEATADWLTTLAGQSPVLLSSPMRRTRESAEIIGARLGASYDLDEGLLEAAFGEWEGLTYGEVLKRDRELFTRWLDDPSLPAGRTGDALTDVAERMVATRDRLLGAYAGRTVVAATHLTPVKLLLGQVLGMPLRGLFRTEVSPASVTVLAWYPGSDPVVRLLNGRPGFTAG